MKPLTVAVAGCGPAGMAAALLLARQGHRVAIHERFAAPRPIGSGLRCAAAMRRSHVQLYQALSRLFTPAYQSDSAALPFVRDRLVPPLARLWPGTRIQAEMVAGTFGGPLKRLGLLEPFPPN